MTPVIELGGARLCMVRHQRGVFQDAAIFQVGGDASCTKRVIADGRCDVGRERMAPHHRAGVRLREGSGAQLLGASRDRTEQRPDWIVAH